MEDPTYQDGVCEYTLASGNVDVLDLIPEKAVRVKVMSMDGRIKWRPITLTDEWEGIEEGDTIVMTNGAPIVMLNKPGRKRNSDKSPKYANGTARRNAVKRKKNIRRKAEFIAQDPFVQKVERRLETEPDCLALSLVQGFAHEIASLDFERREASAKGEDTSKLSYRRLRALKEVSDLCIKHPSLNGLNEEPEGPEELPEALWNYENLDRFRVSVAPDLKRIVIAIDPAVTAKPTSSETGIVVYGVCGNNHGYLLEDASGVFTPTQWAKKAIELYATHQADRIVAEVNNGGDLVETNIRALDRRVAYSGVRATRGKFLRAEPVAGLYEEGLIHHVGVHRTLEKQLCTWVPGNPSPDRLDALVWAATFTQL